MGVCNGNEGKSQCLGVRYVNEEEEMRSQCYAIVMLETHSKRVHCTAV